MAFPTNLDSFTAKIAGDTIAESHVNSLQTAVAAIETKVGIDSSAVATTHDYLLTHLPAQAQNLDIGAYDLRSQTLTSDVVTGTIPVVVTSTTKCTNLNADYVDGKHVAGTNGAGEITTNDGTQSLTNKTLISPNISGATMTTPALGAATATSINGLTIDTTTGTLDVTNAKTLTVTGNATISATPYTPAGTDVALTDGGTGASTQAAAANNVLPSQTGNANKFLESDGTNVTFQTINLASADVTGVLPVANLGTGTASNKKYLRGDGTWQLLAWANVTYSGGTPTLNSSINVSGIVDDGTGLITITWDTDFTSATSYAVIPSIYLTADVGTRSIQVKAQAAGSCQIACYAEGVGAIDPAGINVIAIGT